MHQREAPDVFGARPPFPLLADRPDVLVFQTEPLDREVEVTGSVMVNLWIASSAVDTDFTAKLLDVYPASTDYPEGYHLLLRDLDRVMPIEDVIAWIRRPNAPLPSGADRAAPVWLAEQP